MPVGDGTEAARMVARAGYFGVARPDGVLRSSTRRDTLHRSEPSPLRELPKAALTMQLHYERQYGLADERLRNDALITWFRTAFDDRQK